MVLGFVCLGCHVEGRGCYFKHKSGQGLLLQTTSLEQLILRQNSKINQLISSTFDSESEANYLQVFSSSLFFGGKTAKPPITPSGVTN